MQHVHHPHVANPDAITYAATRAQCTHREREALERRGHRRARCILHHHAQGEIARGQPQQLGPRHRRARARTTFETCRQSPALPHEH